MRGIPSPRSGLRRGIASVRNWWKASQAAGSTVLVPHVVFALGLIGPFVVLCALIGSHWVESEQVRSDMRIVELGSSIADEVDRFLADRILTLRTLAASPALDADRAGPIEAQAAPLLEGKLAALLLRDPAGRVLLNIPARSGPPLTGADLAGLPAPAADPRPRVSDLIGGGDRAPVLLVEVPVVRAGSVRAVLGMVLAAPVFDGVFARHSITGDLMGSLADRTGRVIGRSATSHAVSGQPLVGFAERSGEQGMWFGLSGRGVPLRVAYRRIPGTGFVVSVGMTQAAFLAPLERTLWGLGGLVLALLAGAFALSAPLLRRMFAAHKTLGETAELLGLAQEAAGAALWDWDVASRRVTLSSRSARMHGLPVPDQGDQAVVLATAEWEARVFSEDLAGVWAKVDRAIATHTTFAAEFRVRAEASSRGFAWMQSFGRVVYDEGGRPVRLIGLHFDVTARREAEEAQREGAVRLRANEERLTLALDSGEDGLFDWDIANDEVWVSERWRSKLGFQGSIVPRVAQGWVEAIHPEDREAFLAERQRHLDGLTACLEIEYRTVQADGTVPWVLARGRVTGRDQGGRPQRMVGTLIDISLRKEAEMRVAHMALHDSLTNLPNRNLFNRHLHEALQEAAASSSRYAVLACDLDRFKAVNDTFGHPAGDRLLCLVAERIRAVVRGRDCVARLGGDEFAVILNDVTHETATHKACERIIAAIGEPILFDGNAINIGISIGVALGSGEGLTAEQIFRRADTALYQAKAAGRNTYRLYEAESHARVATRSLIALDMKEAIRRGDFSLVYQPSIDTTTDRVVSFEALMRWTHPERGPVSPGEFIPVAEETGLIVPLGAWALYEACREAMRWPADVRIGVNVSAVQFNDDLEKTVLDALTASGLPAGRLKLEVTESLLMNNPEQAFSILHRLRAMGVRIALDDFGTGYSSLSYLRRFPFDKLKIDRAFVRDIADPDAAAIVRAVVGLGERLGMGVVAEGVETVEQLDIVRREGCTEVQGFLFSKPLPPAEAHSFVLARQPRAAA